jgi:phage-related minor tail protein
MTSIITLLLTLIGQLLPAVGASSPAIQTIINALVAIVPALIQEAVDMVPIVKNIIAALQNNPATTAAQMVTLYALDAQCDAAFEDAMAKSEASDPPVDLTAPVDPTTS